MSELKKLTRKQLESLLIEQSNDTVKAVIEINVKTYRANSTIIESDCAVREIFTKCDNVNILESLIDYTAELTVYSLKRRLGID